MFGSLIRQSKKSHVAKSSKSIKFKNSSSQEIDRLRETKQKSLLPKESMYLIHSPDELVDIIFTVSSISAFNVVVPLLLHPTQRCLQLEWPQKVVGFLKVRTSSQYLMNQIFHTDQPKFTKTLYKMLNQSIIITCSLGCCH